MDSKAALDAWKRADADARAIEARLAAAWELYERNLVAPPDAQLLRDVSRLRALASERLCEAMMVLGAALSAHNKPADRA